ncbi:MAG: glycoside hydrolase family 3 N-terminal domain-containing protein [Porticoccaceae bacterium]|nr:glycoside hydrolase family 3 N-terminal domain-containing protein [Porticoccaceae bacterium]
MLNYLNQKIIYSMLLVLAASSFSIYVQSSQSTESFVESNYDPVVEKRIDGILSAMTLEEKIGQMSLRDWLEYKEKDLDQVRAEIKQGKIGGFLNVPRSPSDPKAFSKLQKIAMEESRLGVPLIFGHDVIHGYKTIFPIPLGQAATWNPQIVELGARVAAKEATSAGIRWTFAPMIDIGRDPRWGRVAETLGEDVFLTSTLAAAMVKGFQGDDLSSPDSMAACAKHFAGYGAAEGGRDYNSAYIPMRQMYDHHLPPFKAAIDAGAVSLMTSYSTLDGVPPTADRHLLTDVLRDQWEFTGFVVSDWNSVMEMLEHGFAADDKEAAKKATNAGLDFEMYSRALENNLATLVDTQEVNEAQIDSAVRRLLRAKIAMGLFENSYAGGNEEFLKEEYLEATQAAASQSFVLLKNDNKILPLNKNQKVAVIGPMAEVPYQQMGTWVYEGEAKDSRTLLPALDKYLGKLKQNVQYAPGLAYSRSKDKQGFDKAIAIANNSDVIVFFGGEEAVLSGEGHSRGNIAFPGAQIELLDELSKLNKPIVLVILSGRPNTLENVLENVDALMMAWHPGTMAGPALVDVLYGEEVPSGKLPITWPKSNGQIPMYYNHRPTGRPPNDSNYTRIDEIDPNLTWQHEPGNSSNYLDYGHSPEFPFGYGLSYSTFDYTNLTLSEAKIGLQGSINASIQIENTGAFQATEIVQLYVRDLVADVSRPVKELKAFERVSLGAGEKKTVNFELPASMLSFHNQAMENTVEPGRFKLWIARHSADEENETSFEIVE